MTIFARLLHQQTRPMTSFQKKADTARDDGQVSLGMSGATIRDIASSRYRIILLPCYMRRFFPMMYIKIRSTGPICQVKWITKQGNQEAAREIGQVQHTFKADPLKPLAQYFPTYAVTGLLLL